MKKAPEFACHLLRSCLLILLGALPLCAAELEALTAEALQAEGEAIPVAADERQVETLEQKGGEIGYRVVSREGHPARAAQYDYLHSSAAGSLFYRRLEKDASVDLEGYFLNPKDYAGDLLLDYRGDYRLHLRTESLFHNLDRDLLFTPGSFTFGSNDPSTGNTAVYRANQDPLQGYGVSVTQDLAQFRYRLHNFPLHLTLGYWRLVREGTVQQRFADTSFEGTAGTLLGGAQNNLFAEGRAVERWTEEGSAGLDAHLGPVDLIYSFKVRQFEDRAAIPTHDYLARTGGDGSTVERLAGVQQHNEEPDSRLLSHTWKAHSSLTGGIVAAASYTLEQRENLSRLSDTLGVKHATVDLHSAAGDFNYTPCKEFTLALKYRRQELDHDGPATLTNAFFTTQAAPRPAVDSVKDLVTATLSFRPITTVTVNTEYRGEYLTRTNVSSSPSTGSWALPEHADTNRGSVALLYRPVKGTRVTAKYSYSATDHPSYGTSAAEVHQGELLGVYTSGNRWGMTASLLERREMNDRVRRFLLDSITPIDYTAAPAVSRERQSRSASVALWSAPLPRTTVSANYAYLENSLEQAVFFTSFAPGSEAAAHYANRSHVYGVSGTVAASERLDLSLMLQQVRSHAAFTPESVSFSATGNTAGVGDVSRLDSVTSALTARADYRFSEQVASSLEYAVSGYHQGGSEASSFNGTVHAIAARLTAKW